MIGNSMKLLLLLFFLLRFHVTFQFTLKDIHQNCQHYDWYSASPINMELSIYCVLWKNVGNSVIIQFKLLMHIKLKNNKTLCPCFLTAELHINFNQRTPLGFQVLMYLYTMYCIINILLESCSKFLACYKNIITTSITQKSKH